MSRESVINPQAFAGTRGSGSGQAGPREGTVIVLSRQQIASDFDAGNPGQWMTHCHNLYHAP